MTVELTWLGQSGFVVATPAGRYGIDLYLSDHLEAKYAGTDKPHVRLHAAPVKPAGLAGLDYVVATHRHSDHLDPGSVNDVLDASPAAELLLPEPLVAYARDELGVDASRIRGVSPGQTVGPFRFVAACHPHAAPEFLSVHVDCSGLTVFHSGDTVRFDGQTADLVAARPDVVLLPVNGRVAEHLGTPPNMSLDEAIDLAAECEAGLLIPHHYDMFAFNSIPPDRVAAALAASGVPHHVMRVGQTVRVRRSGTVLVEDVA